MKPVCRYLFLTAVLTISLGCQALTLPQEKTTMPDLNPGSTGPAAAGESVANLTSACVAAVDGLYHLRSELEYPEYFQQENPARQGDEFDPNRYFDVLTHLKMEPGYTLDYAYRYDGMGGGPLLYARKTEEAPFKTAAELQAALTTPTPVGATGEAPPSFGWNEQYLSHVQVDGTPESYLEFSLLALTGGQFYLFWHSYYYDTVVMCGLDSIKYPQDELDDFQIELPPEVLSAAKKIDFTPDVRIEEGSVTVRLVTFSKWGGFTEIVHVLDRARPSRLLRSSVTPLVEYDCGVRF